MKNLIFLTILLIVCTYNLSAQKNRDVVYLKNGSIIYGTLVEISDNQYRINGSDGSQFIFSEEEVDKYIRQSSVFGGRKSSGIGFSLEAGLLFGAQTTDYVAPFSFNTVVHYTADAKNILGIGTGAEFLGKTYTPLFIEYRHLMRESRVSPYLFFRSGILMYLGETDEDSNTYYPQYYLRKQYSGGASLAAGTGISWAGEEIETYLSFAYRYAHTSYKQSEYNQQDVTYTSNFNRLEIKFGFKF